MIKSIFNILGPIMIGPSSSHTAGAEKLGHVAYVLARGDVKKVVFTLHGSFAQTGKGHGTDKALLAGVMNISAKDERMKSAYRIAKQRGLDFAFAEEEFKDVHPNTVKIEVTRSDGSVTEMMGSSIGGGNIEITQINGIDCQVSGDYPTVVIRHLDRVGVISRITALLEQRQINIVTLKNFREGRGKTATTIIETDTLMEPDVLEWFRQQPYISEIEAIDKI